MGSRGASSDRAGNVTNSPEYKESYSEEMRLRLSEAAVPNALASNNDLNDEKIETQMRSYASAIGDPIRALQRQKASIERVRAMQRQKASIEREYEDYKDATLSSNLGTKAAMEKMLTEYDDAIELMKRIKQNSKRADLL